MSVELAIVGGTVVELEPARVVRADVIVGGGRIVRVQERGDVPPGLPTIDASRCVVTPAFVVGHTHLYSALACGMPPPVPPPSTFGEILERVWWRLDKALDDDLVHISALVGAIEAARRGAAFVVDHHASPNAIDGSLDRIASALDVVGIRGALCYETTDRDGADRCQAGLRENERFVTRARARARDGETGHAALVGAHAPFTLEDRTLDALRDLAERHYAEHLEKPFFGDLADFITSGPLVAMVLEGPSAVTAARQVIGATNPLEAAPGSIRGELAIATGENLVHGSDGPESAAREIAIFFPDL